MGQTNIKKVEFFSVDYKLPDNIHCTRDQYLLSCVGNLFVWPDFEHFHMRNTQMTQCAFTVLLNLFLSAPVTNCKQKKAVLSDLNVEICECYVQKAITPFKVGSNSLQCKELAFTGNNPDDYPKLDPLLMCLSNFEIQLKRLEFEAYNLQDTNLFTAVFSSSTFAVREVRLWWVEFPTLSSESDFHILDELLLV